MSTEIITTSFDSKLALAGVSEEIIAEAKRQFQTSNTSIGEVLVQKKAITEIDLLQMLSEQFQLPLLLDLPTDHAKTDFTKSIPIQYLKKHKLVPLETANSFVIAINDPSDFHPVDDLCNLLGRDKGQIVLSSSSAINAAINFLYEMGHHSAEAFFQEMTEESSDQLILEIEETADLLDETSDAPMIKLVNLLISGAVKDRASDIHIESYQNSVLVRYRIDGILYKIVDLPRRVQSALVSRIKIMARLNIAEKRLPQDGRIDIRMGGKNIDIRVSIIPTAFGERVVLRLLDKTAEILKLSDLGMDKKSITIFNKLIKAPFGIILVTGPTGSGKSTSLYATLCTINSPEINIITIEDPIEYQIEGVGQIQVNPKIELTFANGLRSIVRQDPDVILVGEIRDRETAEIAIQSALTGHLVFSTLHTNDAASAITRIIDMGIEPFLVTSSIIAIVAQRLVRMLCPKCKTIYTPDEESLNNIGIDRKMLQNHNIYTKKGCLLCMNTGYRGRTGIFEIMTLDDPIKRLILKTSDSNLINELATDRGMTTLVQNGAQKVLEGLTTVEEVLRVTRILKRETDEDIE